jgi:hypothetical protein
MRGNSKKSRKLLVKFSSFRKSMSLNKSKKPIELAKSPLTDNKSSNDNLTNEEDEMNNQEEDDSQDEEERVLRIDESSSSSTSCDDVGDSRPDERESSNETPIRRRSARFLSKRLKTFRPAQTRNSSSNNANLISTNPLLQLSRAACLVEEETK